jgi:hypothetical protein
VSLECCSKFNARSYPRPNAKCHRAVSPSRSPKASSRIFSANALYRPLGERLAERRAAREAQAARQRKRAAERTRETQRLRARVAELESELQGLREEYGFAAPSTERRLPVTVNDDDDGERDHGSLW